MSAPHPDLILDDEDGLEPAAAPAAADARPAWAQRLAVAGTLFVALAAAIVVGVVVTDPLANADVFCAAVALAVAGGVLRSIASPVGRGRDAVSGSSIDG